MGENTKTRTLHRNLLFPLALKNESDEMQQNLEEKNNLTSTNKHTSKYEGPITRSRTKRVEDAFLLKANILMSKHFNNN